MYPFKPEIKPGEPSLRIGNRLPDNSANLAFVDGPVLESRYTVELFNYTFTENGLLQVDFDSDFYVDKNRILRNEKDAALIPFENILLTNLYRIDGKNQIPLWYQYTPRFYHYEVNPPSRPDPAGHIWYTGQNIEIYHGETKITDGFEIELILANPNIPNVYRVEIYSNFTASENNLYYVKYSKCDANGDNRRYGFTEVYNCVPYFRYLGSQQENINTVVLSQPGERLFALKKLPNEDGYVCYVPESSEQVNRTPVLFRWRVKGIIENQEGGPVRVIYSPWKSEPIYRKESLFEEDYISYLGKTRYIDGDGIAVKILAENISSIFDDVPDEVVLEHQIWQNGQWAEDSGQIVQLDYDGKQVSAYTTALTEAVSRFPGIAEHSYRVHNTYLTIEGYIDPPVDEPAVITNVSKYSKGATATSNLNTSHFPERSSPTDAIDGFKTTFSLARFMGFFNFPPIVYDVDGSIIAGSTHSMWYARSAESSNPPETPVTTTVNFNGVKNINKVQITLGQEGTLTKIELLISGGSTVNIPIPDVKKDDTNRYYIWTTSSPVNNCTGVKVTVTPTKWQTRKTKRFLFFKISSAKYQTGFDIVEIDAFDYYDPDPLVWSRKVAIPVSVKEDTLRRLNLYEIMEEEGLLPPSEIPLSNVKYKITFGDCTDPQAVIDYNPNISFSLEHKRTGAPILPEADGNFVLTYNQAENAFIVPQVESSEVLFSRKFSATSYSDENIYIASFDDLDVDEMWLPRIHNGRVLIENPVKKVRYEYYIPEYGTQCFYPESPYMYSEQEPVEYIDNYTIKVSKTPMHVVCDIFGEPMGENEHYFLNVYTLNSDGEKVPLPIVSWNIFTGEIKLGRPINTRDKIYCDYYYRQDYYLYYGFADPRPDNNNFYYLDLNPLPGHVCTYPVPDPVTGELSGALQELATWEVLQNKAVYLYILPAFTYSLSSDEPPEPTDGPTLRHVIVERDVVPEFPEGALLLGKIHLNNPVIPEVIKVTDCRRRGGGFKDGLSLEVIKQKHREAESIWDIGILDGRPYPSNGVIELTVPKGFDGQEGLIREIIKKWVAFGVHTFIKYE